MSQRFVWVLPVRSTENSAVTWKALLVGVPQAINPSRRSHLTRIARLHFLAPDIVAAILDGRQPVQLNRQRLARATNLPLDWQGQRQMLGFC